MATLACNDMNMSHFMVKSEQTRIPLCRSGSYYRDLVAALFAHFLPMTIILHHEKLRALWASILHEQYCSFFHANSMPTLSLQETGNRFCVTSPWKKCVSVEKVIFTVLPDLQLMAH